MKNIPLFTSAYGAATLILKELSWSGNAYVLVRSVWQGQIEALLAECRDFCRAVGAENIFAVDHGSGCDLPGTPDYEMITMACAKDRLPPPRHPVELEPLTEENSDAYLSIYNECFRQVPSAASYNKKSLISLYGEDLAWLARVGDTYAAVAELSKTGLEGIAVLPAYRGLGFDLAAQVLQMVPRLRPELRVASTNVRALALYQRLGFSEIGERKPWYRL